MEKDTCIPLFIAGLLIIPRTWKQARCPLTDECIKNCGLYTQWNIQFSSVQLLSHVRLFVTPSIIASQASLSITNSQSSLILTSIESMMSPSRLILGRPLLLPLPIPPSIRVFSNESTFPMRWPNYWSFSFSISPFN